MLPNLDSALIQLKSESLQEAFIFFQPHQEIFLLALLKCSLLLQLATVPVVSVKTSCPAHNLLYNKGHIYALITS